MLDSTQQSASDPRELLRENRFPRIASFAGKVLAMAYRVLGKHRYDDFRIERIGGHQFLVIPSVFNPKVPRTGAFLASVVNSALVKPTAEVLDMGTGSGVCAVFAAARARRVVAVDINAAAVRCARINALVNDLEHRIDVRHGDLFAPVAGERFDVILFNPPFLRGTPRDDRDRAWRSSDVAERFAAGLNAHLRPDGFALIVLSSFGDSLAFLEAFCRQDLSVGVLAERRFLNETLTVYRVGSKWSR